MSNAQADSIKPKSTDAIRSQVLQRFRLRQQEKRKADGKRQFPAVCEETLKNNFKKLKQQIEKYRKRKAPTTLVKESSDTLEAEWRHICPVGSVRDFYIHSRTCEIRLEPPGRDAVPSSKSVLDTNDSCDEERPFELEDKCAESHTQEDKQKNSREELIDTKGGDEVVCLEGDSSWNCQRCTLLNEAVRTVCGVCGVERIPRNGNSSAKKKRYQSKLLM